MKSSPQIIGVVRRGLFRAGIYLPFLIAASYAVAALIGLAEDMFHVTSTSFAVFIALSGGFFALSRARMKEDELRDRIIFGGERALHGALQMLSAAVLEFGFRRGEKLLVIWNAPSAILQMERLFCSILVAAFFISALIDGHRAIETIYGILEQRRTPEGSIATRQL
jgi:hypothetical protein